ncbi:MAG: hypothetical protein C0607_04770 [Azoarcus sp.]|nr:MAG: hypothetical protein C0607_04770 [Azoarcus sp.]
MEVMTPEQKATKDEAHRAARQRIAESKDKANELRAMLPGLQAQIRRKLSDGKLHRQQDRPL